MNDISIRTLLGKYFDGTATSTDISALQSFAEKDDETYIADSGLLDDLRLVRSLGEYSNACLHKYASEVSPEFEKRLEGHIGRLAKLERRTVLVRVWRSVAAVLIVAVTCLVFVLNKPWEYRAHDNDMHAMMAESQILEVELPVPPMPIDVVSLGFEDTDNDCGRIYYTAADDEFEIVI